MQNLELKAYWNKPVPLDLIKYHVTTLKQTDTYYYTPRGRLKIREEDGDVHAIFYNRQDVKDSKISDYDMYEIDDLSQFLKVFGSALREEIIVKKVRELYIVGDTRIHFDKVDKLGNFVEIEVVMTPDCVDPGAQMNDLIDLLEIKDEDKIAPGYRELMLQSTK